MFIQKRRIVAEDVIEDQVDDVVMDDAAEGADDVQVAPEATDLLFEAEDVAELVAEITGEPVEVNVEDDFVTFAVGDSEYTIEAEGDEEILEASTKIVKKRTVSASTKRRPAGKRQVAASKQTRPLRKVTRR